MNDPTYEELKQFYIYLFNLLSENLDTTCIEDDYFGQAYEIYEKVKS